MKNTITCPKCGNVQPDNSDRCFKCDFRLDNYKNYLESIDAEINGKSKKTNDRRQNFYEISPQWQQYVDRERNRAKKGNRKEVNPFLIIGLLILAVCIGSFVKYAIDTGMFKKDKNNTKTVTNNSTSGTTKTANAQANSSSNTSSNSKSTSTSKSNTTTTQTPKKEVKDSADSKNTDNKIEFSFETQNAIRSAESYLNFMAFSKTGLIETLIYDEYSKESATEAVNSLTVDWNEQAVRCAKSYLQFMAFSRNGLIEALEYDGFTKEQAEYAVNMVGYGN